MPRSEELTELKMRPVGPFHSQFDEAALFEWLDKIKCIKKYEGYGRTLYIYVRTAKVDEYELRELLTVFYRYKINMKQLAVFDRDEFKGWFRRKEMYWHTRVFGRKSTAAKKKKRS